MVNKLFNSYNQFKEANIESKYFPPETVERLLKEKKYSKQIIGYSFENRPIYKLSVGTGHKKILLWSQMHGNESTASRAIFDLWNLFHNTKNKWIEKVLDNVQIDFIPQLNPDGAKYYTRRNACNIDINRDFLAEQSTEIKVLKSVVEQGDYVFLFNLHDQRTIFHPKEKKSPATLSFLAPSIDNKNSSCNNKIESIQLISHIIDALNLYIPDNIARFTDEFYPKATGDNFQKLGSPTILIECGHYPNDYNRNETRKFTALSILTALDAISNNSYKNLDSRIYNHTPINDNKALDIIYKNVIVQNQHNKISIDIGIQYEEKLNKENNEISFIAKISEIGDLNDYLPHDICHAENRVFKNSLNQVPNIGDLANFELSDWKIVNGKLVE